VLAQLNPPRVVRLLERPISVDGRHALLLSDAGRDTLADRIAKEGRATLEQLERYGLDLLEAVAHFDARGIVRRDIKPANLAIAPDPGNRKPRRTLFNLSLAREPLDMAEALKFSAALPSALAIRTLGERLAGREAAAKVAAMPRLRRHGEPPQ
jgi:serine/threonine protein kinase